MTKNLKYRIYSVASQSKQFPAQNLLDNQDGWQSQRSPKYPQQLTIQFYLPLRTKSLKLLFHQYKIPKLIEVFVKASKLEKFRKLGYIRPHDNSQSNFQDKQIKTIFFEFPCSFIKLIIHENYKNQYNLFDQVAIDDLSVQGQLLSADQMKNIDLTEIDTDQQEQQNSKKLYSQQQHDNSMRRQGNQITMFSNIYKTLEKQKFEAVEKQDFQKAGHLKNIIQGFKKLQIQIIHLEEQKKLALEKQDFDRCHQLKIQISRKKQMVQYQINMLEENQSHYYSRISDENRSHLMSPGPPIQPILPTQQVNNFQQLNRNSTIQQSIQQNFATPNRSIVDYENQVVPALRNINKKQQGQLFELNNQSKIQQSRAYNQQYQAYQNDGLSNLQIPQNQDLKPLEQKLKQKLQQYFLIIQQDHWKRLFNTNWKIKRYALSQVMKINIKTKQDMLAILQFISFTIQDSHPNIITNSLQLLKNVIISRVRASLQHLPYYIETIIQVLIGMLNDTNPKIRQLAFSSYLGLADISIIPLNMVIHNLIKHKQKIKADPRLVCVKVMLMLSLIQKYEDSCHFYDDILPWAVGYIQDPNNDVRNNASNLLIALSFQMGNDKIVNAVKDIRPNVLTSFMAMLNNSLEASRQQKSRLEQQYDKDTKNKKLSIQNSDLRRIQQSPIPAPISQLKQSEDIDLAYSRQSYFNENNKYEQQYQEEQQPQKSQHFNQDQIRVMEVQQTQCQFCYQNITQRTNHLLKQCIVLVNCQQCYSRIYLRQFTYHLVKQCQVQHQLCKKCGLAFDMSQINQHVAMGSCRPKKQNKQRCQYCCQDISPNDIAWVQHAEYCTKKPEID